ncbi:MAG: 4-alpha-glucanotransferase [Planctomycetes bacterium]|nr:4-alpha-glucanotransferase [Planctomycetota bacterium]
MSKRDHLRRLADHVGILPDYVSHDGRERRVTSDRTREAILAALGFDASTEAAAKHAIEELDRREAVQIINPVSVAFADSRQPQTVHLQSPPNCGETIEWQLEFTEEAGETYKSSGKARPMKGTSTFLVTLPIPPEIGCHRVRMTMRTSGTELSGEQLYVVAPRKCVQPEEKGADSIGGIWTSLYTIRSQRNWGCGDVTDLKTLVTKIARCGAGFALINPIHATRNTPPDISPYRPVSRLFGNPLYIDVEAVPEFEHCAPAKGRLAATEIQSRLSTLREASMIEYAKVWSLKREILRMLHGTFKKSTESKNDERANQYRKFLHSKGQPLRDFALFLVLDEQFREQGKTDWHHWPVEFRNAHSRPSTEFAAAKADQVDFHCYLQFELDQQLGDTSRAARKAGMRIGIVNDLAIGAAPSGFDSWWFADSFVDGVDIGAPPDDLGPTGQNWGLPPFNPLWLRESGFAAWRMLLNAAFHHAGAIRIDHVMGLQRQFWIPKGFSGVDGAYIRFPANELFAILAVESVKRNALVIGEDLGTVSAGFETLLEKWGVLSTRAFYFERDRGSEFRAPGEYTRRAMVSLNTHDMVPWAGFADGADLKLRHELGIIATKAEFDQAMNARYDTYQAIVRRLVRNGLLVAESEDSPPLEILTALCRFLTQTNCAMVAISLDDLAGEITPVNVPGVGPDRFPSWSRRMRRSLEDVLCNPASRRILDILSREEVVAARGA